MEGHVYTVSMDNQTIVADETLIIVHTASALTSRASIIEILRAEAGQVGTDTADQIAIKICQKASAFGAYAAATPAPHTVGGNASGIAGGTAGAAATAGVDATSEGAGTVTTIAALNFNNLNGWLWLPTPEERIIVPPDTAIIVRISGTPTSLVGWSAILTYREIN